MANKRSGPSAFEAVRLEDRSSVDLAYCVASVGPEGTGMLLRISVSGVYGHGSDGNRDATYMHAMTRAACEILNPDGLIVDFSALTYRWGDLLGKVLNVPTRWASLNKPPFAVVEGAHCKDALRSLLLGDLGWDEKDLDWVFDDVERARDFVGRRIAANAYST